MATCVDGCTGSGGKWLLGVGVAGDHLQDVLDVLLAAEEDGAALVQLPGHQVQYRLPDKHRVQIIIVKAKYKSVNKLKSVLISAYPHIIPVCVRCPPKQWAHYCADSALQCHCGAGEECGLSL